MIVPATSKEDLTENTLYTGPGKNCDIVMKGGVTSGIVYPLAVCELAKVYRFKNIGGTSAGAIAAAATAAAELGRHSTHGGFGTIATLPSWFSSDSNLFNLFQPQPATKALFALVTAPLGSPRGRIGRLVVATIPNYPVALVLGALPGLVLAVSSTHASGFARIWGILSAVLLILVGAAISAALSITRQIVRAVPDNFYGLCTGLGSSPNTEPQPLTAWLTELLNTLAGKAREEGPLTFGDLWGRDRDLAAKARDPALREINLEVMTTCLTQGRPYRLPFEGHGFYFDPAEFRKFFPQDVVDWMVAHPRHSNEHESYEGLVPLPESADLPVIVAVRMSLSFPILLSAVPLYAIDYSLGSPDGGLRPEHCWFSDGGITSNLPVHFFDAPLPRWPTFAINLRDFHPSHRESTDECKNVFLPDTISGGTREWWTRFDSPLETTRRAKQPWWRRLLARVIPPPDRLVGFLQAIVRTMQNWVDNAQILLPGYRDRVVHISLSKEEGGTNLKMTRPVSNRLSERGRCAGERLRQRFAYPTTDPDALSWDVHRWVRYRTIIAVLQRKFAQLQSGYYYPEAGDRSYRELISRPHDDLPAFYQWLPGQQQFAENATADLIKMAGEWSSAHPSFTDGAPHPSPDLRTVPHL